MPASKTKLAEFRARRRAAESGIAPPWKQGKTDALAAAKRERSGRMYNPMRYLTAEWLTNLLERAEQQGDHPRLQYLFHFIEKRYGILRAVKRRRLSAISKLNWEIKRVDDSRLAKQQQAELEAVYNGIENLKQAFSGFARAEFRGFSVFQIITDAEGWPIRLELLPHHHVRRDGAYGDFRYCPAQDDRDGPPCVGPNWIIRVVEDPINEIAAINYIPRLLGKQDFSSLVETVGDPPFFIIMPPNVPEDKADEYQTMAEAVIGAMKGTLPNGAEAKFAGSEVRNGEIFSALFDELDSEVVIAATSGKLTVLNEAQGMGSGASDTQDAAFDDLAQAEAAEISELLHAAIGKQWLNWAFPGEPHLAYFEICAVPPDDTAAKSKLVRELAQAGYKALRSWVEETFGIPLEELPEVPPTDPTKPAPVLPVANALKALDVEAAKRAISANLNADFTAIRNALAALLQADGQPSAEAVQAILEMVNAAKPSKETLQAFEDFHAASLLAGWEAAQVS